MVPARLLIGVSIAIMGATAAGAQSGGGDAAANWDRIVRCGAIVSAGERHNCLDGVLRQAGVLTPEREIAEQRESFGQPVRSAAPAASEAPVSAPAPQQAVQQTPQPSPSPAPSREITGLTTTVADALIGGDRLLVVATAEGAVWKQIDGGPFRRAPAKGEAFSVEEGALGSYRCKIGSDIYRCRRVD